MALWILAGWTDPLAVEAFVAARAEGRPVERVAGGEVERVRDRGLFGPRVVLVGDGEALGADGARVLAEVTGGEDVVVVSAQERFAGRSVLEAAGATLVAAPTGVAETIPGPWRRRLAELARQDPAAARGASEMIVRGADPAEALERFDGVGEEVPWRVAEALARGDRAAVLEGTERAGEPVRLGLYLSRWAWQLRALGEARDEADTARALAGLSPGAVRARRREADRLGAAVTTVLIEGLAGVDALAITGGADALAAQLVRVAERVGAARGVRRGTGARTIET